MNRHSRGAQQRLAIQLRQYRSTERWVLGTSADADIVLRHHEDDEANKCYLHLSHAELYPCPDDNSVSIYNASNTRFQIRSLRGWKKTLQPRTEAKLKCGRWILELGEGLEFQIDVLSVPKDDSHHASSTGDLKESKTHASALPRSCVPSPSAPKTLIENPSKKLLMRKHSQKLPESDKGTPPSDLIGNTDKDATQIEPQDTAPAPTKHPSTIMRKKLAGQTGRTYVHQAEYKGILVAVKEPRKPTLRTSAECWRKEKDILGRLSHPSIVQLIDYDARSLSLVLSYGGQDLSKFKDTQSMSQISYELCNNIWVQISGALHYLHSQNILHHDIKPANILLLGSKSVLCDFETWEASTAQHVSNGGTPCYIPPEYLFDRKRGSPSDIWAFGVTMAFAFGIIPLPTGNWKIAEVTTTGQHGRQMAEWLAKVEDTRRTLPQRFSVLGKMLLQVPSQRITASRLVEALTAASLPLTRGESLLTA